MGLVVTDMQHDATRPQVCRGILAAVCHDDPRLLPDGFMAPTVAKVAAKAAALTPTGGKIASKMFQRGALVYTLAHAKYKAINKFQLNLKTNILPAKSMQVLKLRTSRRGIQLGKVFVNA